MTGPKGRLAGIFITALKAGPLSPVASVRAVAGRGLEGDRYGAGAGTFSKKQGPDKEVTLIEAEALSAALRDYGVALAPHETRRNLLTEGIALNHLVGREFQVGSVRMRGIKLCEPCGHLEKLTRPGVREALVHRGGLRAEVVTDGLLTVGDPVAVYGV